MITAIGLGLKLQTSEETTGDEYIQQQHTYDWRRVRTSGYHTGDEYIRVPRGQKTSTYDKRRVHTSRYQYPKAGDQYIPVGRTGRPVPKVQIQ